MYAYGNISCLDASLLWVVWPRKASRYAEQVLWDMFHDVSMYDICTISWWAPWIDMLVHKYSLSSDLPTIVVLGWWLLYYMQWNKRNFLDTVVKEWWLVLSEFKLYQEPTPWSFPQRNRIIAWLCDMLFLPAAWKKSGSLITVDFARGIGKPVYGVPWSVYDITSAGSNAYIQEWKISPVIDYGAILDNYFQKKSWIAKIQNISLSDMQKIIVSYLWWWSPCDTWMIADYIGYTYVDTLAELSMLEIIGIVYFEWDESVWQLRM
jgi:DNA processing protein